MLRSWALGVFLGELVPLPFSECPRQEQDIVFLIDGSGSISFRDFTKMLNFVKAVMSQFQRPSTQVCPWGREGKCAGALWEVCGWGAWGFGQVALAPSPLQFSQFSLMQFSHHSRVHFTFKDFIYSSNPLGLLDSVHQLRGFTYTATAIQMVT